MITQMITEGTFNSEHIDASSLMNSENTHWRHIVTTIHTEKAWPPASKRCTVPPATRTTAM